jgi:hypothetical protein
MAPQQAVMIGLREVYGRMNKYHVYGRYVEGIQIDDLVI